MCLILKVVELRGCPMQHILLLICSLFLVVSCKSSSGGSEVGENSLHLSWTQPKYYEDETQLEPENIAAYYVYWGESESELDNIEEVPNDTTEVWLDEIPSGTYYFAVAVETKAGNRSLLSNIESKTFN